jgi:hypothetical protein
MSAMRLLRVGLLATLATILAGCTATAPVSADAAPPDCRPSPDRACGAAPASREWRDDAYAVLVQQDVQAILDGMRDVD